MTELAIGYLNRSDENSWLKLNGSGLLPGVVSSEYDFQTSSEPETQENLRVNLRGSSAQVRIAIDLLESFIQSLGKEPHQPLCLRLWSADQAAYVYAPIRQAVLQAEKGYLLSQPSGSCALNLRLTRDSLFFSSELPLPLSNSSGGEIITGLTLLNHDDSSLGHDNWCTVNTYNLGINFPSLVRFEVENRYSSSLLADFWLGGLPCQAGESRPSLNLEAENGTGGSVVSHSLASGGKYNQYSWSGSDWQTLSSWTLSPVDVSLFNGGSLTPLLRFFTPSQSEALSLRLLVSVAGVLVYEGPLSKVSKAQGFVELEPLSLPLGSLPLENYASPHQLTLQARQTDTGTHILEIDDLLLLPHQGFAHYHSLTGLPYQARLIDGGALQQSWTLQTGLESKTHHRIGSTLSLTQAYQQHFWCFQTDPAGTALISRSISLKAWYRKQWRLP
ncbi:MAG TPA: hypothetical protein GX730_01005 [Chloroflexi bacterium]|jgi:hypothetical protein|nr:hypothetical protein [Anaerolineaceae bacterium]HHX08000.1 hypothetical protein [Chloroflexota bacterium]